MITIRPLELREHDFFMDMQYESIYILQGKPSRDELLNAPHIRKYSENWGRKGDRALVALINDTAAGAAWYRLFDESDKSYGFVDRETPELGLAISAAFRGQGLGARLMEAIIQQAGTDGYRSLSLSVDLQNQAAVRLYEKLGFQYWGKPGSSVTMKLETIF